MLHLVYQGKYPISPGKKNNSRKPDSFFSIVAISPILRKYFRGFAENFVIFNFAIEALLIISMCLYFYYQVLTLESRKNKINQSSIWAISGIFAFFSTTCPLYIFGHYLTTTNKALLGNFGPLIMRFIV